MKRNIKWIVTFIMVLGILLVPVTGYGASNPDFTVQYWFTFNDNYDEATATWFNAHEEGIDKEPGKTIRLRAVNDIWDEEIVKNVTWTSSNTDVAEITSVSDEFIIVSVKKMGETIIKAVDPDGNSYEFPLYGDYVNLVEVDSNMYFYTYERNLTAALIEVSEGWDGVVPEAIIYDGKIYEVTTIDSLMNDDITLKIKTITIPATVTSIKDEYCPFGYIKSLKAINVEEGNPKYYSIDGVLFDYYTDETGTYNRLHTYPYGKTMTQYRIPEGTQLINNSAFYENMPFKEMIIPKGLELTKYYFAGLSIYDDEYNIIGWKVKFWINANDQASINYVKDYTSGTDDKPIPWDVWYDELGAPVSLTSAVNVQLSNNYNTLQVKWNGTQLSGTDLKYKVEMKKNKDKWKVIYSATSNPSIEKAKLQAGAKYTFRVTPYAVKNGNTYYGDAKTSSAVYIMKKVNKPTVKKSANGKVKVSWTNINGESGYQISKTLKKNKISIVSTVQGVNAKSKVIKAVKGKNYYYKVRAYKTVNGKKIFGPWSEARLYKVK